MSITKLVDEKEKISPEELSQLISLAKKVVWVAEI